MIVMSTDFFFPGLIISNRWCDNRYLRPTLIYHKLHVCSSKLFLLTASFSLNLILSFLLLWKWLQVLLQSHVSYKQHFFSIGFTQSNEVHISTSSTALFVGHKDRLQKCYLVALDTSSTFQATFITLWVWTLGKTTEVCVCVFCIRYMQTWQKHIYQQGNKFKCGYWSL